jgi:hypothetical protein
MNEQLVGLGRLGYGIKLKFWHGEVFDVLGYQRATVRDRKGGDGRVLKPRAPCLVSHSAALDARPAPRSLRSPEERQDFPQSARCFFLVRTHARVDFCDRYGTRRERLTLAQKMLNEKMGIITTAEHIHDDVRIQKK